MFNYTWGTELDSPNQWHEEAGGQLRRTNQGTQGRAQQPLETGNRSRDLAAPVVDTDLTPLSVANGPIRPGAKQVGPRWLGDGP